MDKPLQTSRSTSRLAAVQGLYLYEVGEMPVPEIEALFLEQDGAHLHIDDMVPLEPTLFKSVLEGVIQHKETLDQAIQSSLDEHWRFERLEVMIRIILEAGLYEILYCPETDLPVIINEYVEVANAFYEQKEIRFINGILDRFGKQARAL